MPKVKNLAYPAVAGFALSFFISILVTHHFGTSLLKGLAFAVVFAILAFVIDFVWGRFLGEEEEVAELSGDASKADKNLGNKVDITIDDADLSDDGRGLSFAVDRNRAKLSDADTMDLRKNDVLFAAESKGDRPSLFEGPAASSGPAAPAGEAKQAAPSGDQKASFTPVSLGKPVSASESSKPSSAPAAASTAEKPSGAAPKKSSSGNVELDALPDIGGFGEDDNYVADVDIEEAGASEAGSSSLSSPASASSGNASKATEHDTETLAKAISTVLKRDEMS
ncbi:MAG: hypothetical protein ILP18_09460 [Treponema sp.]|nr:hypothetical protein [Treponema sp.]